MRVQCFEGTNSDKLVWVVCPVGRPCSGSAGGVGRKKERRKELGRLGGALSTIFAAVVGGAPLSRYTRAWPQRVKPLPLFAQTAIPIDTCLLVARLDKECVSSLAQVVRRIRRSGIPPISTPLNYKIARAWSSFQVQWVHRACHASVMRRKRRLTVNSQLP